MAALVSDPLVPLIDLIPPPANDNNKPSVRRPARKRHLRRIADIARSGRIPGVVRIGRTWFVRLSDFERWRSGAAVKGVADAADALRSAGVR